MTFYYVKPSRMLRIYLVTLHALAMIALFAADIDWYWRLVVFAMVIISVWLSWPVQIEFHLRHDDKGPLQLWQTDAWQEVVILPDSVVTPWLAVIRLRPKGQMRAQVVVVLSDSLEMESFRKLRVWLRWKGGLA